MFSGTQKKTQKPVFRYFNRIQYTHYVLRKLSVSLSHEKFLNLPLTRTHAHERQTICKMAPY